MKENGRTPVSYRRRTALRSLLIGGLGMMGGACISRETKPSTAPRQRRGDVLVKVLGTAQDGGLPTMGCHCPNCEAARRNPKNARMVVSLGILNFASRKAYLMEATPDTARQVDLIQSTDPVFVRDHNSQNPIDGVLITHADVGHYPGLIQFRPEVGPVRGLKVHGSRQMSDFLARNEPWKLMVDHGIIKLCAFEFESTVPLDDLVSFEAISVPHIKYTDCAGFKVRGPRKTLYFMPDIDQWEDRFLEIVGSVDYAYVDGTFFRQRGSSKRHPLIQDSMEFFKDVVKRTNTSISFIHLNHDNPLFSNDKTLERSVVEAGFHIAHQGDEIWL
jgi:pyrroloquinoline quinone biosynthesis protein B